MIFCVRLCGLVELELLYCRILDMGLKLVWVCRLVMVNVVICLVLVMWLGFLFSVCDMVLSVGCISRF